MRVELVVFSPLSLLLTVWCVHVRVCAVWHAVETCCDAHPPASRFGNAKAEKKRLSRPVADQTPRGPAGFKDERREAFDLFSPSFGIEPLIYIEQVSESQAIY